MAQALIPRPLPGDGEDVHWALTTAASLQRRGELHEALRWLRRAVAAAADSAHDVRAIELGRSAADFEHAIEGAPTQEGRGNSSAHSTLEVLSRPLALDGLDEPTHVDSRPPPAQFATDEITLVPFTQKAAGIDDLSSQIQARLSKNAAARARVGTDTVDEDGITMNAPTPLSDLPPSSGGATMVDSLRVAVLGSSDGDPRIIALPPGGRAPDGAALALLVPLSKQDGAKVVHLLEAARRGRR